MMHTRLAMLTHIALLATLAAAQPLRITVADSKTGRGVPMVQLTTVNGIPFITDSAGVIAFDEPGLMNADVFITIKSHGYSFPKDGFGFEGAKIRTTPGGSVRLTIDRVNIAERLYRITGAGIYRDSIILGDTPPIAQPAPLGGVLGQDTVETAVYRGKLRWFWGDTNRAAYPLGNFTTSGATSPLPGPGTGGQPGLDPSLGINLTYFTGPDGFSRPMCPLTGPDGNKPGPVWIDGLVTATDPTGQQRMLCHFVRVKDLGEMYERGIAQYNDDKDVFEPIRNIPLDAPLYLRSHPIRVTEANGDYWYFPSPFPFIRCRAVYEDLLDITRYEAFTCLQPGTRYDPNRPELALLDRDPAGTLRYAWKANTAPILQKEQNELLAKGLITPDEALIQLRDIDTNKPVLAHAGSVCWNGYRKAWIMIAQEIWGTSMCGEIWFSQAPALTGPWTLARKIITHDDYSFYNPTQHPEFDQDGGRLIYLEGTYTTAFSGTKTPTPRYDYNQIMYRLDLADPRLTLDPR